MNRRNINVEFPKLDENTLAKERFSKKLNEKIQSKLGQSIPIVNQRIKERRNILKTPTASPDKLGIGINLPKKQSTTQIGMIIIL